MTRRVPNITTRRLFPTVFLVYAYSSMQNKPQFSDISRVGVALGTQR